MARPAELTVFIAWPGDNEKARDRAFRVIGALDRYFHQHHGVRIVAKDWKTHARPAGGNAQTNINNQVGPYDIFVGLLWTRLGMDAGRGKTGFEEEYAIARKQWARRKSSLMVYLRIASPPKLSAIDAPQLQAVRDFVARIQKRYQALYWTYGTVAEFERLLRQHLEDEIHARLKLSTTASTPSPAVTPKTPRARKPKPHGTTAPRLTTPRIPPPVTDERRRAFSRRTLGTIRAAFAEGRQDFNRKNPHLKMSVRKDGEDAFLCRVVEGETVRSAARIAIEAASLSYYSASWQIIYGTPDLHFLTAYERSGSAPHYSQQASATLTEHDRVLAYTMGASAHVMTRYTPSERTDPHAIAAHFWSLFLAPVPRADR